MTLFLYTTWNNCYSLKAHSLNKSLDELLKMSKDELFEYLKQYEESVKPTDSIEVVPFKHGTKILYYHRNEKKPYKTQVYLNRIDDLDLLRDTK